MGHSRFFARAARRQARAGALWDAIAERETALWAAADKELDSGRQRMAEMEGTCPA